MKRGSALIMALWIIAVLSIMVLSFATEAHLQAGINVYVRERNRVNRLIEPGRMLGEVVMLGYTDAKEWNADEDPDDLLEEDRWYLEKRNLKVDSRCVIGPIQLDDENPDSGTITVEIELANSGEKNGININELYKNGTDQNYALRWQMILRNAGIDEELEVDVPEPDGLGSKKHNLMNLLIASWDDWRDDDDTVSRGPLEDAQDDDGAESKWYEEADEAAESEAHGKEERELVKENSRRPRNGSIPDIKELSYVRGFRDFPAVLTGGLLHPEEKESEDNPRLKGIIDVFGVTGSSKVNVNNCTVEQLLTVPGIFDESETDMDEMTDSQEMAQAIIDGLKIKPDDYEVDETRDWWPYKDWDDLCRRVEENAGLELGNDASNYLTYQPDENSVFRMKITGESMGMKREVSCECYVNAKTKKVRYTEWREN